MKISGKVFGAVLSFLFVSAAVYADDYVRTYEVTITNITRGEIFTPVLVASHQKQLSIFDLGQPASSELEQLAEGGDTAPLNSALQASGKVFDTTTADNVLPPGQSVTLTVKASGNYRFISLAAMLVPTNDGFFALNGVHLPIGKHSRTYYSPAYDAGSEHNDESCASIPGPPFICQGEGYNPEGGEGYVHIHAGIHGIGNLVAADHDWRNPVAKITIQRVD